MGRDFRVWNLPKSARGIPRQCVKLPAGESLKVKVEGGLETAALIMEIANDHIKEAKVIMVQQNIDPPSELITFKCVTLKQKKALEKEIHP